MKIKFDSPSKSNKAPKKKEKRMFLILMLIQAASERIQMGSRKGPRILMTRGKPTRSRDFCERMSNVTLSTAVQQSIVHRIRNKERSPLLC